MPPQTDPDIKNMSIAELEQEIMKLRNGIRKHRDQKGDENCWLDDQFYLYGLLPEKIKADPELPDKQLMMINCERYYECRKAGKGYIPLKELPHQVLFAAEWISIKDRLPPFDMMVVVINAEEFKKCIAYNETYNELVMTRVDTGEEFDEKGRKVIYRQVPFEITHWFPLPWWPERMIKNDVTESRNDSNTGK
jgi:hypothetical protein